jgi:hypothetical protein
LHAGFLLRTAAASGQTADANLGAMMTALGLASLRWLPHLGGHRGLAEKAAMKRRHPVAGRGGRVTEYSFRCPSRWSTS